MFEMISNILFFGGVVFVIIILAMAKTLKEIQKKIKIDNFPRSYSTSNQKGS